MIGSVSALNLEASRGSRRDVAHSEKARPRRAALEEAGSNIHEVAQSVAPQARWSTSTTNRSSCATPARC